MSETLRKTFSEHLDRSPAVIKKFLNYLTAIEGKANLSVQNYYYDLMRFFKYLVLRKFPFEDYESIPVEVHMREKVDEEFIKTITTDDILEYLFYLKNDLDNSNDARNRQLSCIKSFFAYYKKHNVIANNPAVSISSAKKKKTLPKYLSLEESKLLLENYNSNYYDRDYCMLVFFLNCGLRLSELVNINISDVKNDNIRIRGKGNKERFIHLNEACISAYRNCLKWRMSVDFTIFDKDALFISKKGVRISKRRVQDIVKDAFKLAGLNDKGFSVHKLRHTAATLMYQYGGVDVRVLQDVLGHESLQTTQIYTHVNAKQVQDAFNKNPLSHFNEKKNE